MTQCLIPECDQSPVFRGVCRSCYAVLSREMRNLHVSESELMDARLLLPQTTNMGKKFKRSPALVAVRGIIKKRKKANT